MTIAREGYDVILGSEAAAAFNQKIDITDAVIAEVDKQKLNSSHCRKPEYRKMMRTKLAMP